MSVRIIALMNQKGGVGKTTTTVNLGAALAEAGKRVCLIDLDPQAHLTINYGVDPSPGLCSLYNILVEDRSFLEAVFKIDERTALVPSSIDLAAAEVELVTVLGREMLLKKKLETAQHDFDFILLDCPPSLGLLTINALAVAHEVIIPMQPHFLALQGVAKLLETVQLVGRRMNPALKVSGIVLTMFDAQTKLTGEVVAELNGFIESAAGKPLPWSGARIFRNKIRRNIKLAESPSFGQTILQYDGMSNGAFDYRALAREVIEMSGEVAPPMPVMVTPKPAIARPLAASAPAVAAKPTAARPRAVAPATRPAVARAAPAKPQAVPPPAAKPVEPALPKPAATVNPVNPSRLAAAHVAPPAASKPAADPQPAPAGSDAA
jgi:chromosome partitioning protein